MQSCTSRLCDFEFDRAAIDRAAADSRLLTMEIEFSLRHQFSCLVTARGEVMPCVGVTLPLGNVRNQPLAAIIAGSQVLKDLKDHRNTIKGPCRTCEQADGCYGCRGAAYQLTGDYLASDPLCWRNCRHAS